MNIFFIYRTLFKFQLQKHQNKHKNMEFFNEFLLDKKY